MKRHLAALSAALLILWLLPVRVLVIEERPGGRILFARAVSPGETFSLTYSHSVEKCLVEDHYTIREDHRLALKETVFGSSNTGLPAVLGRGEILVRGEKGYRIVGMERVFTGVELWVNRAYGNTLVLGGSPHPLASGAGDRLVRLRVVPASPAYYLYLRIRLLIYQ